MKDLLTKLLGLAIVWGILLIILSLVFYGVWNLLVTDAFGFRPITFYQSMVIASVIQLVKGFSIDFKLD